MNVISDGRIIGEIVLYMGNTQCPYDGEHGRLPYGFVPYGAKEPQIIVCDTHCHTEEGYFAGLLTKIRAAAPLATPAAAVSIDNGLLPCPFCGGPAVIELAWRRTDRWIAYCEQNCVGDIHTHYFGAEQEARDAWNKRAPNSATSPQEPIVWRWRWRSETEQPYEWRYSTVRIEDLPRVVREPLYAAPPAASPLADAAREVVAAFEDADYTVTRRQNNAIGTLAGLVARSEGRDANA